MGKACVPINDLIVAMGMVYRLLPLLRIWLFFRHVGIQISGGNT